MSSRLLQSLRLINTHLYRNIRTPAYPKSISKMAGQGQLEEWQRNPPYRFESSAESIWQGKCHCGQVKYKLTRRKPLAVKFCHCTGCQVLHGEISNSFPTFLCFLVVQWVVMFMRCVGAPFQWAAIFHKKDMHFENGTSGLSFYNSSQKVQERQLPCKVSCSYCHTPIMDEGRNMVLLFPELLNLGEGSRKDFEIRYVFKTYFYVVVCLF